MPEPEPERVAELVVTMVSSMWPTTEPERRSWFAHLGLPVDGGQEPQSAASTIGTTQFSGGLAEGWPATSWRFFRHRFVGVSWFLWADDAERETRAGAETLRSLLVSQWPMVEERSDPARGFTCLWRSGEAVVDLYFHAPRELGGRQVPGVVQLHVDHARRADALEAEAREPEGAGPAAVATVSRLLERWWDPIGVYRGPVEQQAPRGEYDNYAGWIVDGLRAGGDRDVILAEMRVAREWMGLHEAAARDEQAAVAILEWWQTRRRP